MSFRSQIRAMSRAVIDSLEGRRLLAALNVNGTTGADTIHVSVDGGTNILVQVNGVNTSYPDANFDGINIDGGSGNDSIYLDATGANPATINSGSGADTVYIGATIHNLDTVESAVVATSSDGIDSLVIDDGEGEFGDTFDIDADGKISRTSGFGGVTQTGFSTISIDAGLGDDDLFVNGTPATGTYRLLGGDGTDGFAVDETAAGATVIIESGAGDDLIDVNADETGTAVATIETTQELGSIYSTPGGTLVVKGTAGLVFATNDSFVEGDIVLDRGFIIERDSEVADGRGYYRERLRNGSATPPPAGLPRLSSSFTASSAADDALGFGYAQDIKPTTFAGFPLETSDLLIRYTLRGDVNLDGTVNFDDLLALAKNYNQPTGRVWTSGDLDLDGDTDFNDLLALAKNYNKSVPNPLAAAGASFTVQSDTSPTRRRSTVLDVLN